MARSSYPCSLEPREAQKVVAPRDIGQRTFEFESSSKKFAVPIKMIEIQGEQRKRRNFEAFKVKQKLGDKTEGIRRRIEKTPWCERPIIIAHRSTW